MFPTTEKNLALHVFGEFLAIGLVAPFLTYVATRRELPRWTRLGSGLIAASTFAVDGYLLFQYLRAARELRAPS